MAATRTITRLLSCCIFLFGTTAFAQQKISGIVSGEDNLPLAGATIIIKGTTRSTTAFTPNNDGINDLFKILRSDNLTEYHLSVYNRWGQKVFETFDYSKGWNGSFNGQMQPSQIFVWYCQFKRQGDAERIKKKGIVTLIR